MKKTLHHLAPALLACAVLAGGIQAQTPTTSNSGESKPAPALKTPENLVDATAVQASELLDADLRDGDHRPLGSPNDVIIAEDGHLIGLVVRRVGDDARAVYLPIDVIHARRVVRDDGEQGGLVLETELTATQLDGAPVLGKADDVTEADIRASEAWLEGLAASDDGMQARGRKRRAPKDESDRRSGRRPAEGGLQEPEAVQPAGTVSLSGVLSAQVQGSDQQVLATVEDLALDLSRQRATAVLVAPTEGFQAADMPLKSVDWTGVVGLRSGRLVVSMDGAAFRALPGTRRAAPRRADAPRRARTSDGTRRDG
jgi:hypothetical protein